MADANITRTEAGDRSANVRVVAYEVELDLTKGPRRFGTTTRVNFNATTDSSWIDLIAPEVRRIVLNGREIDPASAYDGFRISLDGLGVANELIVEADGAYMRTGEGLHRFVDPVDDEIYLYTQFETADARRMYACFEQPDLKATFQLSVTAPDHWTVTSNSPTPEPKTVDTGKARWDFTPTPRVATYITALVAGPYYCVRDEYTGIHGTYPLGVFCRRSLSEYLDSDEILQLTKQGFGLYESEFGQPYPFSKYDQLFVPEFNAGAMENAGCVTILEDLVFRSRVTRTAYEQRANTILHELAHMWFGDLVTMKWWDDLWLNESFAEWAAHYSSIKATRYTEAWTSFAAMRKVWAYKQDQLPSTHPIAADMTDLAAVDVNFDGITYAKGASALKQLVAWVGEDKFLEGIRAYFSEYAWQNTELDDLLRHLQAASGRDLSGWTGQWLRTSGVNLLRLEATSDDSGVITSATIVQEPPTSPPGLPEVLRDHRIGIGLYRNEGQRIHRYSLIEMDVTGSRTPVPDLVGAVWPDLILLNDGDQTFAKIRLDDVSARTAVRHLGLVDDPMARTLLWGAAWDMTRDAEMSCGDFIDLLISGLAAETEVATVHAALMQARAAIDQYACPENSDRYSVKLADHLLGLAESGEPGSDLQLAHIRGFASFATTPVQLDTVAALLAGDQTLPGLVIDADLRWHLLQRLAARGRADSERIEAEAARDATSTGQRHKALALAARPTAEAKDQAWSQAVDSDELPNAVLNATMSGFIQPGQRDLLRPFANRYFEALPNLWKTRTPDTAKSMTNLLYPHLLVEDATVAAADRLLADGTLTTAARRLVAEGRDSTVRALRAQAKDAGAVSASRSPSRQP
ncbi:MAG: aminopeptidase N [Candidatus Nanopelagicales bacterium]|nr:aminopeptidase N [Candidatus Nanopelagicales bacterium]